MPLMIIIQQQWRNSDSIPDIEFITMQKIIGMNSSYEPDIFLKPTPASVGAVSFRPGVVAAQAVIR